MSSKKHEEIKGLQAYGINHHHMKMLDDFIRLIKLNYCILDISYLKFFKKWLIKDLKAQIPYKLAPLQEHTAECKDHRIYFQEAINSDSTSSSSWSCSEEDWNDDKQCGDDDDVYLEMCGNYRRATEIEKEEAAVMKSIGMDALNNGDYDSAIRHFTTGILLDNSTTSLYIKRGLALLNASKPQAAIRDAKKALRLKPRNPVAHKILGKAYMSLNEWAKSYRHFKEAKDIKHDPEVEELLKQVTLKAAKHEETRSNRRKRKAKGRRRRKRRSCRPFDELSNNEFSLQSKAKTDQEMSDELD